MIVQSNLEELKQATEKVATWLQERGLWLNPKKTRITHTLTPHEGNVGFDFLGFTVRHFKVGKTPTGKDTHKKPLGFKTIIKPRKEAVKTHVREIKHEIRKLRSVPQIAVIKALNPKTRGWSNYYKAVVAKEPFDYCDRCLSYQLMSWIRRRHPSKGTTWRNRRYWHRRENHNAFAAKVKNRKGEERLVEIRKHSMTEIQRHVKVRGNASVYDGNLIYWAQRLKKHPLMTNEKAMLLARQKGQCPRCGLHFIDGDLLEVDHSIPTAIGGKDDLSNKMVYHRHGHDAKTAEDLDTIAKYKAAGIMI